MYTSAAIAISDSTKGNPLWRNSTGVFYQIHHPLCYIPGHEVYLWIRRLL